MDRNADFVEQFDYQRFVNIMNAQGEEAARAYCESFSKVVPLKMDQEEAEDDAQELQAESYHSSEQGNLPSEDVHPELSQPEPIKRPLEEMELKEIKKLLIANGIANANFLTAENALLKAQEMGL